MKLLIAEDDKDLLYALQALFRKHHYTVDAVSCGRDALTYLQLGHYDAAILDVMLPQLDGISVLRQLRAEKNTTPILLLTAKAEIEDRVEGLDAGADDYLPKPFDVRELLARVRVLTRLRTQQTSIVQLGDLSLDTSCYLLTGPLGQQPLTGKEYQTLLLLLQAHPAPVSVERILQQVWEPDSLGQENALWTIIYNLRKKLSAAGTSVTIQTKRRLGYGLEVGQ